MGVAGAAGALGSLGAAGAGAAAFRGARLLFLLVGATDTLFQ